MIVLTTKQKELITQHTLSCYPEEMCGGLTQDSFIPLTNISEDKTTSFAIGAAEILPHLGTFIAIVHSHCRNSRVPELFDTRTPSAADIKGQRKSKLPWLIVCCEGETVTNPLEFPRESSAEYIGRPFIWFVNDCYSLVQDYYKHELGIELPNHKADVDFCDLNKSGYLFENFIVDYKFEERYNVEKLVNGELLVLNHGGKFQNHLGIYHNGNVLHQDRLSVEVPLYTFANRINKVLRYVGDSS
jgi:proteasome lid subunit RPN8/RPN11